MLTEEFILTADPSSPDSNHREMIITAMKHHSISRIVHHDDGKASMMPCCLSINGEPESYNAVCWNLVATIGCLYGDQPEVLDDPNAPIPLPHVPLGGEIDIFQWEWAMNAVRALFGLPIKPMVSIRSMSGERQLIPPAPNPERTHMRLREICAGMIRAETEEEAEAALRRVRGQMTEAMSEARFEKVTFRFPAPGRTLSMAGIPGRIALAEIVDEFMQAVGDSRRSSDFRFCRANGDAVDMNVPLSLSGARDGDVIDVTPVNNGSEAEIGEQPQA